MNPKLKIMIPVVRGLAKILGKDYEVNLHDVTMPEHSLVMCENGHVTGRAPGTDDRLRALHAAVRGVPQQGRHIQLSRKK